MILTLPMYRTLDMRQIFAILVCKDKNVSWAVKKAVLGRAS